MKCYQCEKEITKSYKHGDLKFCSMGCRHLHMLEREVMHGNIMSRFESAEKKFKETLDEHLEKIEELKMDTVFLEKERDDAKTNNGLKDALIKDLTDIITKKDNKIGELKEKLEIQGIELAECEGKIDGLETSIKLWAGGGAC